MDCNWGSKVMSTGSRRDGATLLSEELVIDAFNWLKRVGVSPRCTDVAFKFTPRLKVEWQGEGERSAGDILIMASED